MVITFYGTSAELIKMYGIIKGVPRDQQLLICTAQQYAGLQKVHKQLDIYPDIHLARGWRNKDVANMKQMLGLMLRAHGSFAKQFLAIKKLIKENDKKYGTSSVVLVHGDTLTTIVGAYMGRMLALPVAHVEAGLRSGSWKNPFPEELDRRAVSKIARIHFAPNDLAEQNLKAEKTKGDILNTTYNTAKNAIEQSNKFASDSYAKLDLPKHYGIILLHRTELIENKDNFETILKTLNSHAKKGNHLVFTMHTTTAEKIKSYGFDKYFTHKNIHTIPKQPYFDFMTIVKAADYAVTDGGGLQEDAYFLGIPIVVHRERTERQEGIGINATLSRLDIDVVRDFLDHHIDKSDLKKLTNSTDPSKIVVDYLHDKHFVQ